MLEQYHHKMKIMFIDQYMEIMLFFQTIHSCAIQNKVKPVKKKLRIKLVRMERQ